MTTFMLNNEQKEFLDDINNAEKKRRRENTNKWFSHYFPEVYTWMNGKAYKVNYRYDSYDIFEIDDKFYLNIENADEKIIEGFGWNNMKFLPGALETYKEEYPHSGIEVLQNTQCTQNFTDLFILRYMLAYPKDQKLELLLKACPNIVYQLLGRGAKVETKTQKAYQTTFKQGKNFKEMTGMPDWLWKKLIKENACITLWNSFRIWYKDSLKEGEPLTPEIVDKIFSAEYRPDEIEKIRKLVKTAIDQNGKKLYTVDTLLNYLRRLDMYQAIGIFDALDLLKDYIKMCMEMGVEPLTDTNSLKREHDVMARNYNNWRRENVSKQETEAFKNRYEKLSKYSYSNNNLTVLIPEKPVDMINEGKMNRNCVGCYVSSHASGHSTIFFIRKNNDLEHSYITIETNSKGEEVRQAFYSSNRRIENEKDLKFIEGWIAHNKQVNQAKA
jgi:hypothetical protein